MGPSQRIQAVQKPIIPTVAEWTRNTPGTLSLGQGVVAYGPPPSTFQAIADFSHTSENHLYGPTQGIEALHDLIQQKLEAENHIRCQQGYKIIVTAGANMAFLNAIMAITDPGDEIILLLPYYFNQQMAITMLNCTAVYVPTDSFFQPDIVAIKKAITPKTRAIVSISPNNPTGAVYSRHSLQAINNLCREHQLYHISDEAYEYFCYEQATHYSPAAFKHAEQHTISLFSLSKAYGFASWRIGYMLVPEALYPSILKIQDTNLICPPLISQYAAIGALQSGASYCQQHLPRLNKTRNIVYTLLTQQQALIETVKSDGAFYFFIKINTQQNDIALVQKLISDFKIAVIPGNAFGIQQGCYLRIAYAKLSPETAETALHRLIKGLSILCQ